MNSIEDGIINVIKHWNTEVKAKKIDAEYVLDVTCRKKKFYTNRKDFYERDIAEIKLILKGKETRLLWSLECDIPKIKGMSRVLVETDIKQNLYKSFLYECIGMFCVSTERLQDSRDMAEYDIEKDRMKQDESATNMIIQVLTDGPFFTKGDEFDVFLVSDDYYFVYTQHDEGLKNNGIARLPKGDCMVTQNAKIKILTL